MLTFLSLPPYNLLFRVIFSDPISFALFIALIVSASWCACAFVYARDVQRWYRDLPVHPSPIELEELDLDPCSPDPAGDRAAGSSFFDHETDQL